MAKLQKYLFDMDFGAPLARPVGDFLADSVLSDDADYAEIREEEPPPPPPPTFSEEELQLARDQAFEAGHTAGIHEAETTTARMEAQALQALGQILRQIDAAQTAANEDLLQSAVAVAVAVVRKLQPEMARAYGLDEMEALIHECLAQLDKDVRVTIRVHPSLVDAVRERAETAARSAAFEGKLLFTPDPRVAIGDCRVEWGDGGAERDQARIWGEVDSIIARALGNEPDGRANTTEAAVV